MVKPKVRSEAICIFRKIIKSSQKNDKETANRIKKLNFIAISYFYE